MLELVGRLQVGIAGGAVGGGIVLEVEEKGEHLAKLQTPRVSAERRRTDDCPCLATGGVYMCEAASRRDYFNETILN